MKKAFNYDEYESDIRYIKERANAFYISVRYFSKSDNNIFTKASMDGVLERLMPMAKQCDGYILIEEIDVFLKNAEIENFPSSDIERGNYNFKQLRDLIGIYGLLVEAEYINSPAGALKRYNPSEKVLGMISGMLINRCQWDNEKAFKVASVIRQSIVSRLATS